MAGAAARHATCYAATPKPSMPCWQTDAELLAAGEACEQACGKRAPPSADTTHKSVIRRQPYFSSICGRATARVRSPLRLPDKLGERYVEGADSICPALQETAQTFPQIQQNDTPLSSRVGVVSAHICLLPLLPRSRARLAGDHHEEQHVGQQVHEALVHEPGRHEAPGLPPHQRAPARAPRDQKVGAEHPGHVAKAPGRSLRAFAGR